MPSDAIVVLGAGPAGISAAWRLSARGERVTILERDAAIGGMAKTIRLGDYAVDYGPHTFHIRETPESRAIHQAIRRFSARIRSCSREGRACCCAARNTSIRSKCCRS